MQMSHKKSLDGHLDHAQITASTDYHLQQVRDGVCPEDAAAAALYAVPAVPVPGPGPFPPGSWQPHPAAWFS